MNLADLIALAKQGYKPSDVKELIEMADKQTAPEEVTTVEQTEPINVTPSNSAPELPPTPEPEEVQPNYKQLYEESQKALKLAQIANTRQPVNDNRMSDEEAFADLARSFM